MYLLHNRIILHEINNFTKIISLSYAFFFFYIVLFKKRVFFLYKLCEFKRINFFIKKFINGKWICEIAVCQEQF